MLVSAIGKLNTVNKNSGHAKKNTFNGDKNISAERCKPRPSSQTTNQNSVNKTKCKRLNILA